MSLVFDGSEHEVANMSTISLEAVCRYREVTIEAALATITGYNERIAELFESDLEGNRERIASITEDRTQLEGDCACWAREIREIESELEIRKIARCLRKTRP